MRLFPATAAAIAAVLLSSVLPAAADEPAAPAPEEPAKKLILPGESFRLDGRAAFILLPEPAKRSRPQPWILYAPTLPAYPDDHEKWMHTQFLEAGVAVAGIDTGESYGSPAGREGTDRLYRELTERRGFAKRACLLGRSRGGLWVTSWAIVHPDRVAGIAGIYPVFDLTTYPGVETAAPAYGLMPPDFSARLSEFNPAARLSALAKARIPVFLVHGDEDRVVPLPENSGAMVKAYEAEGVAGLATLITEKGQGHNLYEGFFRCRPLVEFAIARAKEGAR